MLKVRNRSNQQLPIDIIEDGDKKRVFLLTKQSVKSEGMTDVLENLEERRLVVIREIEDEVDSEDLDDDEQTEEVIEKDKFDVE